MNPNPEVASPEGLRTFEEHARSRHQSPYVFEVASGSKRLVYFGASHTDDPESAVLSGIADAFQSLSPQLVLVEGARSRIEQWARFAEELKGMSVVEAVRAGGEPWFSMKLAADAGVPADSPEPDFAEEVAHVVAPGGVSREAAFAYYGYRVAAQYHRMAKEKTVEEYVTPYLERFAAASRWEDFDFSVAALARVGEKFWGAAGASLGLRGVARFDPIPWSPPRGPWTEVNLASQRSTRFRDLCVVRKIEEALQRHDRILVVFGSSHAFMQEPAVRAAVEKAGEA